MSAFFRTTPWNRLPASVVTASSLDVFKGRVLQALHDMFLSAMGD